MYCTEPAPPPSFLQGLHTSAAFKLLWELRNLTDSRTLHLGPKHFPDPRFSGPYQHCRGMGPRSLLFQNLRACLSLLLTLGAIGYVSAVGRTPALGVTCVFSPAPPQRRAFPRCKTLLLLKSFIDFEQGTPGVLLDWSPRVMLFLLCFPMLSPRL